MSDQKIITDVLPVDCLHEIVSYFIHNLKTLYSCITVNKAFCQLIIPILWSNPFDFKLNQEKNILIIRTYFSCLNDEEKLLIIEKFSKPISEFPKPFVNYPSFLKEFELSKMQQHMRTFLRGIIKDSVIPLRVNSVIRELNPLMGKLFVNKQSNYKYVNICFNEQLSLAKNQMNVSSFDDEIIEQVLLNINKFSFGFRCDVKDMDYYLFIQDHAAKFTRIISKHNKDIQHISIPIQSDILSIKPKNLPKKKILDKYDEIIETLRSLILSLNNLKSFSTACFWKDKDYLDMFRKHSNSLTYLKLTEKFLHSTVFDILNQCPNLKTIELFRLSTYETESFSSYVSKPITLKLNYLENLNITILDDNIYKIFERILLTSKYKLKTLFLNKQIRVISSHFTANYRRYFTQTLQPYLSNLSHFFLKITNKDEIVQFIPFMKTLKNLIHFKFDAKIPILIDYKELSISFPSSLKILEVGFYILEESLIFLLYSGKFDLSEFSMYSTITDATLKVLMNYARKRNSLTVFRYKDDENMVLTSQQLTLLNQALEEAKNLFIIDDNPKNFDTSFIKPIF